MTRASGGGAANCSNCVMRRESWKLPSAPSSKLGVEPIANTNRIVPAVVGEARDKRKRVTLPNAVDTHFEAVAVVPPSLESTSGYARGPAQ